MKKKNIFILSILLAVLVTVSFYEIYHTSQISDNKLYISKSLEPSKDIAKIDSSINIAADPVFTDLSQFPIKSTKNEIILFISSDKKFAYTMTPVPNAQIPLYPKIIKGPDPVPVNIQRLELATGKRALIASSFPFVTTLKWSPDERIAAFSGGGRLLLYDTKEDKLLFGDELKSEDVSYFGWSADGTKLYTERANLPNGIILYLDTQKKAASYEAKEAAYFKYRINNNYFYGTKQIIDTSNTLMGSSCKTVILNADGSVAKEVCEGVFKDAYNTALLFTDNNNILYYLGNFNSPASKRRISSERIYDAKFIYNGGFAYTTESKTAEANNFILHLCSETGDEISSFEIPGSSFLVDGDGKKGYTSGSGKILSLDFVGKSVEKTEVQVNNSENIYKVLRGGFNVISDYIYTSEKNTSLAEKYFDSSLLPGLWKTIDSGKTLSTSKASTINSIPHPGITMKVRKYTETADKNGKKASLNLEVSTTALWMENYKSDINITLIQRDSHWYIYSFGI